MQIKKKPFLLIELFISLILLGVLLTLFGSLPFKYTKKELFALQELQIERLKDVAYSDFIQKNHPISSKKKTLQGPYTLLGLNSQEDFFFTIEYHHKALKKPKDPKDKACYLLQTKIYYKKFAPSSYSQIITSTLN